MTEKEWEEPKDVFEAANLRMRIKTDRFMNVFERENAKNWLKNRGYWNG